jgi:hypothetical protein
MRQAAFKIESLHGFTFRGFTKEESWNGWACPYFAFEQAQEIADAHSKCLITNATYNEIEDKFVFGFSDENEEYSAISINGKKLYPIGNASWIWEELRIR